MRSLLLVGFELGVENVNLFIEDVQTKMDELDLLDLRLGIQNHDPHREHDFVEAVMRIGADFRGSPRDAEPADSPGEPFDWRTIPPDIP